MLHLDPLPTFPTSPVGSEGYSTEASSTAYPYGAQSPTASITSLGYGMQNQQNGGDSPSHSPLISSDPSRLISDPSQWSLNNFETADIPYQRLDNMLSASPDITIDVGKGLVHVYTHIHRYPALYVIVNQNIIAHSVWREDY